MGAERMEARMTTSEDGHEIPDPPADCPVVDFHDNRIDMAYWFPKICKADVPVPKTHALLLKQGADGPPSWDLERACEVVDQLGGEAFVRSGYKSAQFGASGSHARDTSYTEVDRTLKELVSQHVMMQMPLGESLWLREYLDLDFCAYARDPLVPEVRVFIRDGDVVCHHPRLEGFEGHEDHRETAEEFIESGWDGEWREETVQEYAERVADVFDGDGWWSVDFVMDRSGGWYCTDMALDGVYNGAERGRENQWQNISEHASGCENNLMEQANADE